MRHVLALASLAAAFLVSIAGVSLILHYGSNGGIFANLKFPALATVGVLAGIVYYLIARPNAAGRTALLIQSSIVAVFSPILVLLGPLTFCVFFRPGASCM